MAEHILVTKNPLKGRFDYPLDDFNMDIASKARRFHESSQQYQKTPLVELQHLAKHIGLAGLYIKDESYRFNLNAFKGLGGSYMMASYIAGKLGKRVDELSFDALASGEVREQLAGITFISATAGNHGRGLAWVAKQWGVNMKIYIPKLATPAKVEAIRKEGAECIVIGDNFDLTFAMARKHAAENGWVLIQDTTFDGYRQLPLWCMQGYTTSALEAHEQFCKLEEAPTHIFIQAGAGGFAGSIAGFFRSICGKERPFIVVLESDQADAMRRTAEADDGTIHYVRDELDTISAGLACGEPSSVGWEVLRDNVDAFIACDDIVTVRGMRVLGNPLRGDRQVISGESGAIGLGAVCALMTNPVHAGLAEKLHLDANSRVLCFNTEGDTTPDQYRKIVWDRSEL